MKRHSFNQIFDMIIEYATEQEKIHKKNKSELSFDCYDYSIAFTDLKESLKSQKGDDYRLVRKKFKEIFEVFLFDDYSYILKTGMEQEKGYAFFESDIPYLADMLINYTSKDFKYFREHKFEACKPEYIIKQVDEFLNFVKKYFMDNEYYSDKQLKTDEKYKEYKKLIYCVTNYKWLSQKMLSETIRDFCRKIDGGFLFPITCFCSERKCGNCNKVDCKNNLSDRGCTLHIHEENAPHKDFMVPVAPCFRQDHLDSGWLNDEEKSEWIKYAYDMITKVVKHVDRVLETMDEIKGERIVEEIFKEDFSGEEDILAWDLYITEKLYEDEEFKTRSKEYAIIKNKNTIQNNKKLIKAEKEYFDYVKNKRMKLIVEELQKMSPTADSFDIYERANEIYDSIEDEYPVNPQAFDRTHLNKPSEIMLNMAKKRLLNE